MEKKILGVVLFVGFATMVTVEIHCNLDFGKGIMFCNLEALANEELDSSKYSYLDSPCFDSKGQADGRERRSCFQPGYDDSCSSHDCE